MIKTIDYTDKPGGNTVYADIPHSNKNAMLRDLERGFYKLLEISNYDLSARDALYTQTAEFNRHTAAGKNINNCCASFLGGLFAQHNANPNKDISTKMLKGVKLASQLLNAFDSKTNVYEFNKISYKLGNSNPPAATTFDRLFGGV
jgi:hypothetical protein